MCTWADQYLYATHIIELPRPLKQTLPPPIPRPLLLNFKTLKEKQDGLVKSFVTDLTPSGPNALSHKSNSVRCARAVITASPKLSLIK